MQMQDYYYPIIEVVILRQGNHLGVILLSDLDVNEVKESSFSIFSILPSPFYLIMKVNNKNIITKFDSLFFV